MSKDPNIERKTHFFLLAVGDKTRASSRLRVWAHFDWFRSLGQVEADYVVPHGIAGRHLLLRILMRYPHWIKNVLAADVLVIQETLVLAPVMLIRRLMGRKLVIFDFSDPIDRHAHGLKGLLRKLGFKIMVNRSDHVVVENRRYLSDKSIRKGAASSFYGPIDVTRLRVPRPSIKGRSAPVRIGWTGSPATVNFLAPIFPALDRIAKEADIELVLMGCTEMPYDFETLKVILLPWSEADEFKFLPTIDLGLFALEHTEEGKRRGAGKLFLYLSAGVPFAASEWGIAADVMTESCVGFAVDSPEKWEAVLSDAIKAPQVRARFAKDGRAYAETNISYEVYRERLEALIRAWLR